MTDYYKKYIKYKKKYLNYKSKYFIKGGVVSVPNTFIFDETDTEKCLIIKSMILDYWHDNPLSRTIDRSATFIVTLNGNTVELKNILDDTNVQTYLTNRNPKGGGNHDIKKQHFFMGLVKTSNPTFFSICCLLGPGWLDHFKMSNGDMVHAYNFLNAFDQANAPPTKFGKCKPLHSATHLGDGFAPIKFDKLLKNKYENIKSYIVVLNTALIISFYKRYGFLDECRKPYGESGCYHFIWAVAAGNIIYFYSFCGVNTVQFEDHPLKDQLAIRRPPTKRPTKKYR